MNDEHSGFREICKASYVNLRLIKPEADEGKDQGLKKTIELLELGIEPWELHNLSLAASLISGSFVLILLAAAVLTNPGYASGFALLLMLPLVIYLYIEKYPSMMLESKKTEILGHLPSIASYLVISLRISPILEKAVEFTAENTQGSARRLLRRMITDIELGKNTSMIEALSSFADDWGDIPEYKAFTQLLIASTLETGSKGRWMMLDKGINVLLTGLRNRTDAAVRKLEAPILLVFTFLVILPMVFIGLVPALPTVGISLSPTLVFIIYDIVLPAILFIAISFITESKPVTVPPIEMPEKKTGWVRMKGAYLLLAIASAFIFLLGALDLVSALGGLKPSNPFGTSLMILGISLGAGMCLFSSSYSIKKMRDNVKEEEEEFTETLRQLSVLLSSGRPLPNAMAHITDLGRGKTARIFAKAANNIRLFNIGLRSAFFGEKEGSARDACSKVIKSSIETIISMSEKSPKAIAAVLIRLSEHVRNMRAIDTEMKKIVGSVTSSMMIIAVFVGPLVGGVATGLGYLLSETFSSKEMADSVFAGLQVSTLNPEIVKLIIGIYVLETSAILTLFSDELVYGRDKVIKKYHLGMYLPTAALVYSLTVVVIQEGLKQMI